jgi:hypothetical protein
VISRGRLRPMRRLVIVLGLALHVGSGIVHADVPGIADMTTCNQEAREELRDRSASPNSKDQVDAEAARRQRDTAAIPAVAGAVTQSEDPQIHGMDAHGATSAAYRAAYRVCMRKRGF